MFERLELAAVNRHLAEFRPRVFFRITHGADVGMGEHRRRDILVTHAARSLAFHRPEQMVHHHHRLAQCDRGELHTRRHVAHGIDGLHRGLVVRTHLYTTVLANRHTQRMQSQATHIRHAPGGVQHLVHDQTLAYRRRAVQLHFQPIVHPADTSHIAGQAKIDTGFA